MGPWSLEPNGQKKSELTSCKGNAALKCGLARKGGTSRVTSRKAAKPRENNFLGNRNVRKINSLQS